MKENIKKLDKKGETKDKVIVILIAVVLLVSLIPVLANTIGDSSKPTGCPVGYILNETELDISDACYHSTNSSVRAVATAGLSAVEVTLLGLVALFMVLALVFGVVKKSGLTSK